MLLLSLVFISMSFLAALLSLFGNPDDPKRIKILAQRRALLFKGSLACAFASLALGLASMLSFRIELASHVRDFNDIAGAVAEAKLGTAYGRTSYRRSKLVPHMADVFEQRHGLRSA